jgi:transposase
MGKKLSDDLKWRVIYCYNDGLKPKDIAKRLYISKSTANKVCKIFNKWGCVNDPFSGKPGRRKLFTSEEMKVSSNFLK